MRLRTPSELDFPAILLCFPFSLDNKVANNVWMKLKEYEPINYSLAFKQFTNLYQKLSKEALVYFLPSQLGLQDQTYVANLGCELPHLYNIILISNFKSKPRIGEDKVGKKLDIKIILYK